MVVRLKEAVRSKQVVQKTRTGNAKHIVRIIGGQWKRTPIAVADAEGLRPTPERVRGTLFNWLNHLWDGSFGALTCLDMFAGTGALGFEAASRGFQHVTMIEKNRVAFSQLQTVKSKLEADQVEILPGDALVFVETLRSSDRQFDLIFLDPPFQAQLLPKILPACWKLLATGGMVYVETDKPVTGQWLTDCGMMGMEIVREGQAGQVYYHLLKKQV